MNIVILRAVHPPSIASFSNGTIQTDILVNVRIDERYDALLAPETAVCYKRLAVDCVKETGVALGISGGGAHIHDGQDGRTPTQGHRVRPHPRLSTVYPHGSAKHNDGMRPAAGAQKLEAEKARQGNALRRAGPDEYIKGWFARSH